MSGLLPAGGPRIYTTAKFAVVGMMESLRAEMENEDVGVSVYCPGLVHTNIYQSERNRPAEFANDKGAQDPKGTAAGEAMLRDRILPAGMDPLEAGQKVLRGVRNNDLFILSHPEFRDGMQERFRRDPGLRAGGRSAPGEPACSRTVHDAKPLIRV